jgi:predicted MPP superfamily phosphohydrolase
MFWLLFFYLLIYGAVHAELYLRVRPLLPRRWTLRFGLLAFFLIMVLLPILARVFERLDLIGLACATAWAAYLWMAFALFSWAFSLILWVLEWLLRGALSLASSKLSPGARAFLIIAAFPLALTVQGFALLEARNPVIEQVVIATPKLPAGRERLRLVQISDLHLGCMMDKARVARIINLVESQHPDILVATGDIVDGYIPHHDHTAEKLAKIKAPLGKFAITGNHEYYAGLAESIDFIRRAGFTILRQQSATPAGLINLVGVDDSGRVGQGKTGPDELPSLRKAVPGLFTILLKHRPWVNPKSAELFDLQLSGHTHGGQVYPFRYLVALAYPHIAGLYPLAQGSWLYVNRGAGTWGPPIRLLATPEITVVDLLRDNTVPSTAKRPRKALKEEK